MKIYYTCEKDGVSSEDRLLRALCLYLGDFSKRRKLNILRDASGKPRAAGAPELDFSVTHTGDWWICAVGRAEDGPFGIDAELRRRSVRKPDTLSRRFFRPEEARFVSLASGKGNTQIRDFSENRSSGGTERNADAEKESRFLKIWVRKEAYLKYTGAGLAGGMSEFMVSLCLTQEQNREKSDGICEDPLVEFQPLNLSGELYAVLCCRKNTGDRRIELCRMK